MSSQLVDVDRYFDAAPRPFADVVDVGPLRVFLSRGPWPYYVRPRSELDLHGANAVGVDDVRRAAEVLTAAGHAVSVEWVEELVPSLAPALAAAGFAVTRYPLLHCPLPPRVTGVGVATGPGKQHHHQLLAGVGVLAAADDDVVAALAVSELGFADEGTALGTAGVVERDAAEPDPAVVAYVRSRIATGSMRSAVLRDPRDGVVATGSHIPVGATTELVGIATVPTHRRRGYAASLVRALLDDATSHGCTLAVLSAGSDDVARIYEREGFTRIGHTGAAVPRDSV